MTETTNPAAAGSESGAPALSALDNAARLFGSLDDHEEVAQTKPQPTQAQETSEVDASYDDIGDDDPDVAATQTREKPTATVDDTVKVKLSDGSEVTLAELKAGHMKAADYTRKTQALAEERRQAEALQARVRELEPQLSQQIEFAEAVLRARMPPKPSAQLAQEDPFTYQQQRAEYDEWASQMMGLQQAKAAQSQRAEQARAQRVQQEVQKLHDVMPELKDPAKLGAFREEVHKAATDYGFSPEEVNNWLDHRIYPVIRDAMKYRNIVAGKREALEKAKTAPPVIKPGTRNVAPQTDAQQKLAQARNEFKKSGSVKAAASVLEHLID